MALHCAAIPCAPLCRSACQRSTAVPSHRIPSLCRAWRRVAALCGAPHHCHFIASPCGATPRDAIHGCALRSAASQHWPCLASRPGATLRCPSLSVPPLATPHRASHRIAPLCPAAPCYLPSPSPRVAVPRAATPCDPLLRDPLPHCHPISIASRRYAVRRSGSLRFATRCIATLPSHFHPIACVAPLRSAPRRAAMPCCPSLPSHRLAMLRVAPRRNASPSPAAHPIAPAAISIPSPVSHRCAWLRVATPRAATLRWPHCASLPRPALGLAIRRLTGLAPHRRASLRFPSPRFASLCSTGLAAPRNAPPRTPALRFPAHSFTAVPFHHRHGHGREAAISLCNTVSS
jgi:hypothetical protein